jgi:hypothetical protein
VLAACWAHARHRFYEMHRATGSPIAAEVLRSIAEFYAIETTIRSQTSTARKSAIRKVSVAGQRDERSGSRRSSPTSIRAARLPIQSATRCQLRCPWAVPR